MKNRNKITVALFGILLFGVSISNQLIAAKVKTNAEINCQFFI